MKCPNCGQTLKPEAVFCPECGTKAKQKTCPHCGAAMRDAAVFCPMCGQPAAEQDTIQEVRDTQPFPAQPEPPAGKGNGIRIALICCVAAVLIVGIVSATFLKVSSQNKEAALAQQDTTSVGQTEIPQTSTDTETVETGEPKVETPVTTSETEINVSNDRHAILRAEYQARIDGLWTEMDAIDQKARNQADLSQLSYDNYQHWDSLLNEIYQDIKSELSNSAFEALKESETVWIAQRDATADERAADWVGGTGYTAGYYGALSDSTGKRCQWLVDQYLN